MQTLPNSAGVRRLSIGITNVSGKRVEIRYAAETNAAPLVAIDPDAERELQAARDLAASVTPAPQRIERAFERDLREMM